MVTAIGLIALLALLIILLLPWSGKIKQTPGALAIPASFKLVIGSATTQRIRRCLCGLSGRLRLAAPIKMCGITNR